MKICVITPRLNISGVPLAQIRLAESLIKRGHDVNLIVGYIDANFNLKEHTNTDLKIIHCKTNKTRWMTINICKYLIKSKVDIIFSAEDHLNAIILIILIVFRIKTKISCSSRVTPFDTYSNTVFSKRWFLKKIMEKVMWRADVLACVSKDMVTQYKKTFKNCKHICIYNIVLTKNSIEKSKEKLNSEWIKNSKYPILISTGKLATWKGFDVLIKALNIVIKEIKVRLIILGDGPERNNLQNLIDNLNLNNFIKLEGYVDNPYKYFSNSNIFVLSSYVEGMPNVLVEAMMLGCTPVSTDCETGPAEIINDGYNGYLSPVGDHKKLSESILRAINNPIDSEILLKSVSEFTEEEVIKKQFDSLNLLNAKY